MTQGGHLYTLLTAASTAAGSRVYAVRLPQQSDLTYPAISYAQVSQFAIYGHDGAQGLYRPRWQIDCWAESPEAARALAKEVRGALSGVVNTSGGETYRGAFLDSARDDYDDDARVYRVQQDYMMWHEEAA